MEVKESRAAASRRKRLENLNSSDPEVVAWQLAVERRKNERAKAKRAAETPEQREERLTKRRRREAQRRASQHQRQDQESVTDDPKTRRCTVPLRYNKRKQPGRCSRRGNVPVESAKAVQTEATGSFPGRVDVAVGTSRVVDRDVCKSAQTSLAAEKVHVWTETVDLDAQDSGPCVGKISELSSPQKFEDGL
ncbi:uncharacterized protein [Dermacentor andersoni]|uniref:uncharacterized protein isoform X4 n=1 Tax=Dermacentor andersoni TaxID=34620 RepID=UPI002154FB2E|nr:uncharacterized protein LOC126544439 isoform X4 [Dermacentor andersoni]